MHINNIKTGQELKIKDIDLITAIVNTRAAALNLQRTDDTDLEISYLQSNHFINPSQGRDLRLLIDEFKRKIKEEEEEEEKPDVKIENKREEIQGEKIKDKQEEGKISLKLYGRLFLGELDAPIQLIFKKIPVFLELFKESIEDLKNYFIKSDDASLDDIYDYFQQEAGKYSNNITAQLKAISLFANKKKPILDLLEQLIGYCAADKKAREDENSKTDDSYLKNYFKYAESLSILETGFDFLKKMNSGLNFILAEMKIIQTYYIYTINFVHSISQADVKVDNINNNILPKLNGVIGIVDKQLQATKTFANNLVKQ